MAKAKSKKHSEPTEALADATPDEVLEAQQKMLETGEGAGVGYIGTMSPEEKDALAAELHDKVNDASDSDYNPRVAPAFLGRDPDADFSDMDMEEGEEIGTPGSRVGFATVPHPRSRMAAAMHDGLSGYAPSEMNADELSSLAEKVGMEVNGTGANGTVLKADLVRAMDGLAAEYPAAPVA